jgi:hypothetical protein
MNQPKTYLWLPAYLATVLETDNTFLPTRIYEALAAMEQRFVSRIETGGDEPREIENAQRGLLTLKTERIDWGGAPASANWPSDGPSPA